MKNRLACRSLWLGAAWALLIALLPAPAAAAGKLNIITTTEDLAALTREVGAIA